MGSCPVSAIRHGALRWYATWASPREMCSFRMSTSSGAESRVGQKFQMALTPAETSRSVIVWDTATGVVRIAMRIFVLPDKGLHGPDGPDLHAGDLSARPSLGSLSKAATISKTIAGETRVAEERLAQVSRTHQDSRVGLVEAEHQADGPADLADLVSHAADAHEADGAEVLSDLGGIDIQDRPQLGAGDCVDVLPSGDLGEVPVVPDQPFENNWPQGLQLTSCRPQTLPDGKHCEISITLWVSGN